MRVTAAATWAFWAAENVRMVPMSSTLSGMMLLRTPPLMMPTENTAGMSVRSTWRLITVCTLVMICAATTMGSTPFHGAEPWAWRPVTTMRQAFESAKKGPER